MHENPTSDREKRDFLSPTPTGAVHEYDNMIGPPNYKMATVTLKGYVKRSVRLIIKKMAYQLLYSIIHSI